LLAQRRIHKQGNFGSLVHRLGVKEVKKSDRAARRVAKHEANLPRIPKIPVGLLKIAA
jgi:hypothetical protein